MPNNTILARICNRVTKIEKTHQRGTNYLFKQTLTGEAIVNKRIEFENLY